MIVMDNLSSLLAERTPILASVVVLLGAAFIFSTYQLSSYGMNEIPLVGAELGNAEKRRTAFVSNAKDIYAKGYALFRDKAWRLTGTDGTCRVFIKE